jgi:hypothetical protein
MYTDAVNTLSTNTEILSDKLTNILKVTMEQNCCQVDAQYCKQEGHIGSGHWPNSVGHSIIHSRSRKKCPVK